MVLAPLHAKMIYQWQAMQKVRCVIKPDSGNDGFLGCLAYRLDPVVQADQQERQLAAISNVRQFSNGSLPYKAAPVEGYDAERTGQTMRQTRNIGRRDRRRAPFGDLSDLAIHLCKFHRINVGNNFIDRLGGRLCCGSLLAKEQSNQPRDSG